ncbi:MAG: S8 family serine peptidase [Phycisphaerae bacterium]|jgi:hypothetical protein|nr:S8 family serine peptidase [Phycisphaerae bacterium]
MVRLSCPLSMVILLFLAMGPASQAVAQVTPRLDRLVVRTRSTESFQREGLSRSRSVARHEAAIVRLGEPIGSLDALRAVVVAPPARGAPIDFARSLAATGDYDLIEFDLELAAARGAGPPNDPLLAQQWHLAKINAPMAWSITLGDPAVVVAVCDSGVDLDHPDLAPILVPGYNAVDHLPQTIGGLVDGLTDHGTEVAGCVAAATDNAIGIGGLGWDLRLMPIRVSNQANDTALLSDIANGATWAVDHGASVVNVSFSSVDTQIASEAGAYVRSEGGVLVWAAGNAAASLGAIDPATILVVGATDANDGLASFTNVGAAIDLVAPGVGITTTKLFTPGGGYASPNGTSFAAPIVSGVLGLVRSANPNLSPAASEFIVTSTAKDLGATGEDNSFGAGRVDAGAAVALAAGALNQPIAPFAQPDAIWSLDGDLSVIVTPTSNDFDLNGDPLTIESFDAAGSFGGRVVQGPPTGEGLPTLIYSAPPCFEGTDEVAYTISDGSDGSDTSVIAVSTVRAPTFAQAGTMSTPGFAVPKSLEAGDLDGDGDTDLVGVYSSSLVAAAVFTRGPGGFVSTASLDLAEIAISQVRLGHVGGSTRRDVLGVEQLTNRLVVAVGLEGGGFAPPVVTTVPSPTSIVAQNVLGQPLDANLDGNPDVIVGSGGFPALVRMMFGDGNGGFTPGPTIQTLTSTGFLELADLTGDGKDEVIAVVDGIGKVMVLSIGLGGTLTQLSSQESQATPSDLAIVDIDGDGDRDVIVNSSGVIGSAPGARILTNTGSGQLNPPVLLPGTGTFPTGIAIADFDRDGDMDLAEANLLSSNIGIHPGYQVAGSDWLAPVARVISASPPVQDLVAMDEGGDGGLTLATIANTSNGQLTVRLFTCTSSLPPASAADLDGNGIVGASDLAILLGAWGTPLADLDGSGLTGAEDVAILLGWWGESAC